MDHGQDMLTKRVLRKLDYHVLPPIALLWLANFLDRSNIGNARISGLERDTHLHGNQFNTALAVFYITYIIVEVPSNAILKKFKANASRWIALLVLVWGIVTTLTGLVQNYAGLLAVRLCLGLCEGGLLPGMVLYLSSMYKRHELQIRIGVFYAAVSLSGAFGGLLATAISKMDGVGGLAGWRWIFILEGLATILASLVAGYVLPADLNSASFFTEEEKAHALWRFQNDNSPIFKEDASDMPPILNDAEEFEWREIKRGVLDVQTWLTGLAFFGQLVSLYSYSFFLPTIITGLGYSGTRAQLYTVPPYVPAAALTVIVAYFSDKLKLRGPFILVCLPLTIVGYIISIAAQTNKARYAAVFLIAAGIYPSGPCMLSILANNTSGHYKRATATALQTTIANLSGFLATFAYTPVDQAPEYIRGHSIALAFVIFAWIMVAANVTYCMWENKARREGRRDYHITKYEKLRVSGKTRAPIGDRHPGFMFTL
ncbi:hypothetical protein AMATHDRAFT_192456 [Amanita thiersii Skay4041]|uniref:Major facilitator superfamily (MFS) profile domain-containing protein n=1 Tax=Amanita thiersii Skay4041 TaxID=703135 RepID=A0A2A9NT40_9AGAR|nr:hypothetical protein AMATHDRAFT_192456 [Amanita thiersii Skay4041]